MWEAGVFLCRGYGASNARGTAHNGGWPEGQLCCLKLNDAKGMDPMTMKKNQSCNLNEFIWYMLYNREWYDSDNASSAFALQPMCATTREFACGACAPRQEKTSSWAECIIEECSQESGCRRMENWVFRKEHAEDYEAGDACEGMGSPRIACHCIVRDVRISLDHFIREACVSSSVGVSVPVPAVLCALCLQFAEGLLEHSQCEAARISSLSRLLRIWLQQSL